MILCRKLLDHILMQFCFQFCDFENFREIISKISRISSFKINQNFPPNFFSLSKK